MKAGVVGMEKYLQSCNSEFWQSVFREELNYLLNHLKGTKDILSIGCGQAIIETGLAKYGFNVTGLDISGEALNQTPDNIRKVKGSADKTDFPDSGELINLIGIAIQKRMSFEELETLQMATHPLLTAAPTVYPIVLAAQDASSKM